MFNLDYVYFEYTTKVGDELCSYNQAGMTPIYGTIWYNDSNECEVEQVKIGSLTGYKLLAQDYDFLNFDGISQDLCDIATGIEIISRDNEDFDPSYFLILDRIFIEEKYRNKGVAKKTIENFMDYFDLGLCDSYIFLQAASTEYYSDISDEEMERIRLRESEKLRKYYEDKFNFQYIDYGVMYRVLNPDLIW